ncbi:MAG TPA: ATP-binding protein, partial [Longimicrobiales bacterium]|nr:ATP-binding protein [Longimicrobiales bacterium]
RDRILGAMTLVCGPSCRSFRDDDVELARELAARAAVSLDHAQLLEAERMARLDAERREAASRLLARTSSLLASPRDYREGLRRFSDILVPELADLCVVLVLEEAGGLEWVALRHADPEGQVVLEEARAQYDPTGNPRSLVLEVLAGERAVIVDEVTAASFDRRLGGQAGEAVVRELDLRSLALVPLRARGRRIGVLVLGRTSRSGRSFGEDDRLFLEEVALRAAVAVDNADLLRDAHEARREAEEASRAKNDFLAVMSHELRTPLNAIVGYGDLLDSEVAGPITADQRKHLSRLRASAWHLLDLIEEILSLSKIEAGKVELEWEEVDAADLAREAADLIRPEAKRKELSLRVDGPGRAVRVETDRSRVRQVLVNLLSNAVKFTDAGFIVLSWEAAGQDEVRFHVRDTGPGIPAEEQDAIFEAFSRAGEGGEQRGGTGLGLAVCRRFARLLGGDVTVESDPGEGSVFTVRLPASRDGTSRDG